MRAALAALLLAAAASAQTGALEGAVLEAETGAPVAGASVLVLGTGRGDAADAAGRFRIEGVPAGPAAVRVQAVGYTQLDTTVVVPSDESSAITMVPPSPQTILSVIGAGDALTGVLTAALAANWQLVEATRFAQAYVAAYLECPPPDLPMRQAVPYDTSLSTDATVARLGTTPLTTRQILERFREERALVAGGTT